MSELAFGITLLAGMGVILMSALLLARPLAFAGGSGRISFALVGLLLGVSLLAGTVPGRPEPAVVVTERPAFMRASDLVAEVNDLSDAYQEAVAYCRDDIPTPPSIMQFRRRHREEMRGAQQAFANSVLDRQLRCEDAANRIAGLKPPVSASVALTMTFRSAIAKCADAYATGAMTLGQVASFSNDRSNLALQSVSRSSAEQSRQQIRECEISFYAAVARARRQQGNNRT